MKIQSVAVLGLGAIGCTVASGIYRAIGSNNFEVIATGKRKERLVQQGMKINGINYYFHVSDVEEDKKEDLIILAVKSYQLEQAIKDIRNHVGSHTLILSFMNGVTSEKRIADTFGKDKILYSLTTISSQMKDNAAFFSLKAGVIQFGEANNATLTDRVQAVAELFQRAEIPYEIPQDMIQALWKKYLFNISNNTVAAILHARHCYFQKLDSANNARRIVLMEAKRVAEAKGITITDQMVIDNMEYSDSYPEGGYCSMVQDIEAGRHTEKETFLGDLICMAQEEGVDVPICKFLYQILDTMEKAADYGWTQHIQK